MTATLYDANPKSRSPGLKRADPAFATAIRLGRKPQIPIAGTETKEGFSIICIPRGRKPQIPIAGTETIIPEQMPSY